VTAYSARRPPRTWAYWLGSGDTPRRLADLDGASDAVDLTDGKVCST
jgi:hypothetical protein